MTAVALLAGVQLNAPQFMLNGKQAARRSEDQLVFKRIWLGEHLGRVLCQAADRARHWFGLTGYGIQTACQVFSISSDNSRTVTRTTPVGYSPRQSWM